jgi:hypothetical protein
VSESPAVRSHALDLAQGVVAPQSGLGLIVGIIAGIIVVMRVYGYTRPISATASAPPSPRSSTTTGVAPAPFPKATPFAATPFYGAFKHRRQTTGEHFQAWKGASPPKQGTMAARISSEAECSAKLIQSSTNHSTHHVAARGA